MDGVNVMQRHDRVDIYLDNYAHMVLVYNNSRNPSLVFCRNLLSEEFALVHRAKKSYPLIEAPSSFVVFFILLSSFCNVLLTFFSNFSQ